MRVMFFNADAVESRDGVGIPKILMDPSQSARVHQ
jgi:hypothetical protein